MTTKLDGVVIPVFPTRKQVAEVLGVSMATVRRLDAEGFLRRSKGFGKPIRYVGESVRRFAEGR